MAKLPLPPVRLPTPTAAEVVAARGTMTRIYRTAGSQPSSWSGFRFHGPLPDMRFDPQPSGPPADSSRGVLYGALHTAEVTGAATCLAEVFQRRRAVERTDERWLAVFTPTRPVTLLDLSGAWPTRAGSSQAIASGRRDRARAWSRAVYEQFEHVEGFQYPSAVLGGGRAVALFDRAAPALPSSPDANLPLSHPGLLLPLARICAAIGYDLV